MLDACNNITKNEAKTTSFIQHDVKVLCLTSNKFLTIYFCHKQGGANKFTKKDVNEPNIIKKNLALKIRE